MRSFFTSRETIDIWRVALLSGVKFQGFGRRQLTLNR